MKKPEFYPEPFVSTDGELAAEHDVVSRCVEEALETAGASWYRDADLKSLPAGQTILDAKPDQARRYMLAAVAQTRHWDREAERVRSQGETEMHRLNAHHLSGWDQVWGRRLQANVIIAALTRRALPFQEQDLLTLIDWCSSTTNLNTLFAPLGNIARALQRYADKQELTPALLTALRDFAALLRGAYDKDAKRLGTVVEQLCADAAPAPQEELPPPPKDSRPIHPAPAGNPAVLDQLKHYLGVPAADAPEAAPEEFCPDRFALRANSTLKAEHQLLSDLFNQAMEIPNFYWQLKLDAAPAGKAIIAMSDSDRGRVLLAATERAVGGLHQGTLDYTALSAVTSIAMHSIQLDRDGLFDFLLFAATRNASWLAALRQNVAKLLGQAQEFAAKSPLTDGERYVLYLLRAAMISGPPLGSPSDKLHQLNNLIGDGASFFLVPGEAWSDAINADLAALPPQQRQQWAQLLRHAVTATAARPSSKWLKSAAALANAIGEKKLATAFARWLPLVNQGRSIRRLGAYQGDTRGGGDTMHEENAIILRGFLWLIPTLPQKEQLIRPVVAVCQSAYRKVPGVGPRAVKVGNAAVYALSKIGSTEAVGQLAMLKVRIKFGTAQKEIEKAFNAAAESLGLPRDQIEEMGLPTYGMEEVGLRRESFGDEFTSEIRVEGRDVSLHWFRADGKPQKSLPPKAKTEHKDELKELQGAVKDIAAMLPAQAERLDGMFLLQNRWPIETWRERYLNHPLVGTLARRLIWSFDSVGREQVGTWLDGKLVDVDDAPLDLSAETQVELWHPINRPMDDVLAWRAWLERHQVRQPFKQAHREVYLLTEAERRTNTYSNRFAAHIIRQHQFNALCAARGWKNKLRLMVDDAYPPASRMLPNWGLRAEFWIEGIGDDYGTDTNESGVFLRLATDQVRFYRVGAANNLAHAGGGGYETRAAGPGDRNINEPLPVEQVPPLVFSEVMRDVDLFVGVASVGNDPAWQDGGPQGRYRDYWHSYSFGDLSQTAETRKAVLERIVPRLKIADRCRMDGRFLIVRGDLRTYRIHLGSGNILMEPNDQYLCIVPGRGPASGDGGGGGNGSGATQVFLPFEGDQTLSVILSKAFLLADDRAIKDPSIVSQIRHRHRGDQ